MASTTHTTSMIKVWIKRGENVPEKFRIISDSDIDDLKTDVFGKDIKGQYLATYNGQELKPSTIVPQHTTHVMPISFLQISAGTAREPPEFPAPGSCEPLDCKGRPCAKCHKCRDWHFTGDKNTWDWICNHNNWEKEDVDRWCDSGYKNFVKHHRAKCAFGNAFFLYYDDRSAFYYPYAYDPAAYTAAHRAIFNDRTSSPPPGPLHFDAAAYARTRPNAAAYSRYLDAARAALRRAAAADHTIAAVVIEYAANNARYAADHGIPHNRADFTFHDFTNNARDNADPVVRAAHRRAADITNAAIAADDAAAVAAAHLCLCEKH